MDKVLLTTIDFNELISALKNAVREELQNDFKTQLQETLLSPAEACKVFQPKISKVTLIKWTKDGLIPEHRIGGRVFYKYSELINSLKTLKKYKRPAAN